MAGGDQQQLLLARAIILEPEIMLIDEPSLGLAPAIVEQAFNHIEKEAPQPQEEDALGLFILNDEPINSLT